MRCGSLIYSQLLSLLRTDGIHLAVAVIAQPNPASVALHEKLGFELVGTFSEVGRKFGRWVDTSWYQLALAHWSGLLEVPPLHDTGEDQSSEDTGSYDLPDPGLDRCCCGSGDDQGPGDKHEEEDDEGPDPDRRRIGNEQG